MFYCPYHHDNFGFLDLVFFEFMFDLFPCNVFGHFFNHCSGFFLLFKSICLVWNFHMLQVYCCYPGIFLGVEVNSDAFFQIGCLGNFVFLKIFWSLPCSFVSRPIRVAVCSFASSTRFQEAFVTSILFVVYL